MSAGLKFCYFVMLHVIYISAAKQLIVINLIQNKSFCLHNIYVFTVYIMYKYTHIQYIFWKYLHVYIYITYKYLIFILRDRWMLESDWLTNVLRCAIIFRETHGESSSRQLSWPHYSSVSLRQMISVISKVLQQKNNQNPQRHWPNK